MRANNLLTKADMARVAEYDTRQAKLGLNLVNAKKRENGQAKMPLDLENAFWTLQKLKLDMSMMTWEVDSKIEELQAEKARMEEPYKRDIETVEEQIKEEINGREKSYKCDYGQAIYRSGAIKAQWDDAALLGYAAAGHEEIEQFRTEKEGKSSIVLKVEGV